MKKKIIFNIILSAVILFLTFYLIKDIDFLEVLELFKNVNLFFFFLALFSFFISCLLWGLRFKLSLRNKLGFLASFKIIMAGLFINTITPGSGFGGEPVRVYYLRKNYKEPVVKCIGAILTDKAFHLFVFFSLIIVSALFLLFFMNVPKMLEVVLQGVIATIVFLSGLMIFLFFKRRKISTNWLGNKLYGLKSIKNSFNSKKYFKKYLEEQQEELIQNFEHSFKKLFFIGIIISVGFWFFLCFSSYLLFLSIGLNTSIILVAMAVILSFAVGDLSPLPGGVGVMEGSMFLLYSAVGISPGGAFAVALLSRVVHYIHSLGIGGLSFFLLKFKS